ncbi:thioredoxin family protein [Clostridium sp. D2Q-14]|uniref:thioredoxin family protein n=1 Tax=Anaeromonas gelatinilytica TaxID=2683194 RepID=UPI00193B2B68|nr:thioredoxin family protein [Anaeromonas gelatinilytica]MBS4535035.1 thioredoxin family protein [Anaeromonas gelatinilytica]
MNIKEIFNSGISFEEFVNNDADTYKEKTLEIYQNIEFDEKLVDRVKGINKKINILACAEIWCPDCMINVPVLKKMKDYNDNIDIAIVLKEGNEEIFKKYGISGAIRIPTFIIYDEKFNELGSFVEYPKEIKNIVNSGNQPKIIVAKRKYRKGEYANETLKDILNVIY